MPAVIFFFFLVGAVLLSMIGQHFIPPFPAPWFTGARVLLMPVFLFYGALAMPFSGMLGLAFIAGFFWDALTLPVVPSLLPGGEPLFEIPLGWSIILYAVLGSIMNGMRPWFRRGRWEIHCLLSGVFTALIVVAEYLMIALKRIEESGFLFPGIVWQRALGSGLAAMLLAPLVFFLLNTVGRLIGFEPHPERETLRR